MNKPTHISTPVKQAVMLKALQSTFGAVTRAAKMAQITTQTHYNWYKSDENYRAAVDNIKFQTFEEYKDAVMEAVLNKVKEGNATVITRCFQTLFSKWAEQMQRTNPYLPSIVVKIKPVDIPPHETV